MDKQFYLTWRKLWHLFTLRLLNPSRAEGFRLEIVDYNMDRKSHERWAEYDKLQEDMISGNH